MDSGFKEKALCAFCLIAQPKVLYPPCMLNENSIADFKANLRGRLIQPGDADYDDARKVYNGMIHKKPRLIARCQDAADVIRSVNFARENDLLLAVRCGGHNAGGLGICDDGLVIDLRRSNTLG